MSRARDVADGALGTIAGTNGQVLTSDGNNWSSQPVATDLINDTSPELGGNLTMGSHAIADGVLPVKNNGTQSELRLYCEAGSHYVGLKSPAHSAFSGNHTITMPPNTGTSGQFLSTDGNGVTSWAAAGGGGAFEHLATVGSNSAADFSFNNVFNATYDTYMFVGTKILPVSSNNQSLLFNFKVPAGVSTGNFRQQIEYSGNTSGNSTYNSFASQTSLQTYYLMNYEGQDTQVNGEMNFVMYVHNPFLNAVRGGTNPSRSNYRMVHHTGQNSSDYNTVTVNKIASVGVWQQTTQATGCRFMMGSGNMFGNIDAYGLKHS